MLFIYHPEMMLYKSNIENSYLFFFTDFVNSLINHFNGEVFFSPFVVFIQLLFVLLLLSIFLCFYLSNYTSYYKEESTVDSDYLLTSSFVEAEKEISSFDDVLVIAVVLIFLFG